MIITYRPNSAYVQTGAFTSPPQIHLGRATSPPFTQSMDSATAFAARCMCY